MSSPLPYLVRMLLFLAAVGGLAYVLHEDLLRVFLNTPILNGVIVGVLVIGIFFVIRQVISLWPEVKWLRRFQHREEGAPPLDTHSLNLLAPLATMLGERQDRLRLSPTATRAVLDGIATRLDERRELTRYLIGLLIFLGLLGTFWGLLETIGAVADAINGLQVTGGDAMHDVRQAQGAASRARSRACRRPSAPRCSACRARWCWASSNCRRARRRAASTSSSRNGWRAPRACRAARRSTASRACRPMSRRCSSAPPTGSTT